MRYGNGSANLIKGHPTNEKTKNNMKITNAIVWDHRGRVPENGTGQVEIRITLKRKSYHFGTGIKCHKSELVAGRIVNCPGADELNKRIGIIYAKVLAMVNACLDAGVPINTKDIREKVWQVVESQSDQPTLIMVKDCTIALTFQIEKRMMREVAYRRSVGSCKIIDKELVIRCQCISHGDVKISRESIQSVR